ncbi:MAG: hypothetical protein R2727_00255 [Bacteroidales bacterium]
MISEVYSTFFQVASVSIGPYASGAERIDHATTSFLDSCYLNSLSGGSFAVPQGSQLSAESLLVGRVNNHPEIIIMSFISFRS